MRAGISASLAIIVGLVGLGLGVACRAGEGDRCICAGDCKSGLVCVSGGRQLRVDECIPAAADNEPGECVQDAAGADGDLDADAGIGMYMDLGSKRDFDPGAVPSETGSGTAGGSDASGGDTTGTTGSGTVGSGTAGSGTSGTGTTGTGTTGTGTGTGTTGSGTGGASTGM